VQDCADVTAVPKIGKHAMRGAMSPVFRFRVIKRKHGAMPQHHAGAFRNRDVGRANYGRFCGVTYARFLHWHPIPGLQVHGDDFQQFGQCLAGDFDCRAFLVDQRGLELHCGGVVGVVDGVGCHAATFCRA